MADPVIVDDRDPNINYDGKWRWGGTPSERDGTTTGTYSAGSKATFTFIGLLMTGIFTTA
jgi:hypothetical protein